MLSIVLVLVLAGCMPQGESGDGPAQITYFHPGLEQPEMREMIDELVQEFEQKHPDIDVKVQSVGWDQSYQKLVSGFNAGEAPDVIYGGSRWIASFAAMQAIQPLNAEGEKRLALYPKPLQKAARYQGKAYGIPRGFSSRTLIYRTDLIEEPPQTWEELVQVAKKVQQEHEGIYGFGVAGAKHVSTTMQYFNYLFQNGGQVFDEKGNVKLNSPEAAEALQFYADLYRKHQVVPNPLEYNREQLPILFKEGKIAMFVCGPWARQMMARAPDNEKTPYKAAPLPKGEKMANTLVSDSLMISAQTEHPEAAWTFIQYITSPKEQTQYDIERNTIPLQTKEAEDPFFQNDPYVREFYVREFVKMIDYGKPQPAPKAWEPFEEIVTQAVQRALNGEKAEKVLDDAAAQIKKQQLEPK